MLEEAEIALARAELHVIEARGRLSDQRTTIDRLKGRGEDALEAEQTLGLFEAYLFIMERHRDFLRRSQRRSEAK
jgi:outer membrane protein TolC